MVSLRESPVTVSVCVTTRSRRKIEPRPTAHRPLVCAARSARLAARRWAALGGAGSVRGRAPTSNTVPAATANAPQMTSASGQDSAANNPITTATAPQAWHAAANTRAVAPVTARPRSSLTRHPLALCSSLDPDP